MSAFLIDKARKQLTDDIRQMFSDWIKSAILSQNYTNEMQICSLCDYSFSYKQDSDKKKDFGIDKLLGGRIKEQMIRICDDFNESVSVGIDRLNPPSNIAPRAYAILVSSIPWAQKVANIEASCDGFNYSTVLNNLLDAVLLTDTEYQHLHVTEKEFKSARKTIMKSSIISILQSGMSWERCKWHIAEVVNLKIGDTRLKDALHNSWKWCSWDAWDICAEALGDYAHDNEKMAEALIVLTMLLVTPYNHQKQYPEYEEMFQLHNDNSDNNVKGVEKWNNLKHNKLMYNTWLAKVEATKTKQDRPIMPSSYPYKNDTKAYAEIAYRIQVNDYSDIPVPNEPQQIEVSASASVNGEHLAAHITQGLTRYSARIRDITAEGLHVYGNFLKESLFIKCKYAYDNFLRELSFTECSYAIMIYGDSCDANYVTLFKDTSELLPHVRFVQISKSVLDDRLVKNISIGDLPTFFVYDNTIIPVSGADNPNTLANSIEQSIGGQIRLIATERSCNRLIHDMEENNASYAIMLHVTCCDATDVQIEMFEAAAAKLPHIRFVRVECKTQEFASQCAVILGIGGEVGKNSSYFVYNRWMEINRLYDVHATWLHGEYKIRRWPDYMNPRQLEFDDKAEAIRLYDNHEKWWGYMVTDKRIISVAKDAATIVSRVVVERAFGSLNTYIRIKEGCGIYAIDDEGGTIALQVIQQRNWWKTMARQLGCFYRNVPFTLFYASMMNNTCFDILLGKYTILDKATLGKLCSSYKLKRNDNYGTMIFKYGTRWDMIAAFQMNLQKYVDNDGMLKEHKEWFDNYNSAGELTIEDVKPIFRCIPDSKKYGLIRLAMFKSFPAIYKSSMTDLEFEKWNQLYNGLETYNSMQESK